MAGLGAVIESTLRAPGVVMAVIVDRDGYAIDGASRADGDLAAAARSGNEILKQWVSVGSELRLGHVRSMLFERPGGPVAISPAPRGNAVVITGEATCRLGRLRREARVATEAVAEIAGRAAIGADHPARHPDTVDEGRRSTGRLTPGEVVLVGAHTFRLVTRVVARLLQTQGVRSSRLRAYSPGSTIIDVSLEEGATLAAIGRACFGDVPIERDAAGHSRLVLRAPKALLGVPTPIGSPG